MSYPAWPSDVPQPRRDGHSRGRQDTRRMRATDSGAPVFERRLTLTPHPMTVTLTLTQPQLATFWMFFDVTCQGGTRYFWMPDPVRDGWPLLDETGAPLQFEDGSPWFDEARMLCAWGTTQPEEGNWRGRSLDIHFDLTVMP
ncbi:hypothetical protein [Sagittula salina]|uniref:Uncharacterized protein n=1 Tax=Sagittula salina TaxID=2820268 RepID=A0A940MS02_9RHOB|nr:hypothetical protein [Sagittula salina]MBP0483937.1 hypothetical protein [Sagittula salina]